MTEPDEMAIAQVKAKYPDRALELVSLTANGDEYHFVMTGPSGPEWKKFLEETSAASGNAAAGSLAIERAALAQIRWPERDEVRRIFDSKPALVGNLAEVLTRMAGVEAEVRAKKL